MRHLLATLAILSMTAFFSSSAIAEEICHTGPLTGSDICIDGRTVTVTVPEPEPVRAPEPVTVTVTVTATVTVEEAEDPAPSEEAEAPALPEEEETMILQIQTDEDGCIELGEQKLCPTEGLRETIERPRDCGAF